MWLINCYFLVGRIIRLPNILNKNKMKNKK